MVTNSNTIGGFFNEKEYERYVKFGLDYLNNYMSQIVFLYKVNKGKSNVDDLYFDPVNDNIILDNPISIQCLVELQASKNTSYDNKQNIRISEYGNLIFTVLDRNLTLSNVKVDYGDYVLYVIEKDNGENVQLLFQIIDDDKKHFENNKTWAAFRAYYHTFVCVPVDENSLKIN